MGITLQLRHNECDDVSNHQPYDCSLNRLLRLRSNKTSKLRVTGLCEGNSPVTGEFPAQMASNAENVFIWWRHHGIFEDHKSIIHPASSPYAQFYNFTISWLIHHVQWQIPYRSQLVTVTFNEVLIRERSPYQATYFAAKMFYLCEQVALIELCCHTVIQPQGMYNLHGQYRSTRCAF